MSQESPLSAPFTLRMWLGSLVRSATNLTLRSKDNRAFAKKYTRAANRLFRRSLPGPIQVQYDNTQDLFLVTVKDRSIYVARRIRLEKQMRGVLERQALLGGIYLQGLVELEEGDVVIECGAHIGEFSLYCANKGAKVFAFEPDPTEFRALTANSKNKATIAGKGSITPVNMALASESGTLSFYTANDSGDSSLIDPGNANTVLQVAAISLDHYTEENLPSEPIKLLKLEAEGAEPEVLRGAAKTLERVRYVTVAAGPERGVSKETTLAEVTEIMYEHGFRMIGFGSRYYVAIFEKQHLPQ